MDNTGNPVDRHVPTLHHDPDAPAARYSWSCSCGAVSGARFTFGPQASDDYTRTHWRLAMPAEMEAMRRELRIVLSLNDDDDRSWECLLRHTRMVVEDRARLLVQYGGIVSGGDDVS